MSQNSQMNPIVIGLTGQSGAGKTLVSRMLKERNLAVINADQVARDVVDKGKECLLDLAVQFGVGILTPDGYLDRKKLSDEVFDDPEKLKHLNRIIFPYITKEIDNQIDTMKRSGERLVVLDAPTLFESGYDKKCDRVISVLASRDERMHRIVMRDRITYEDAERRLNAQHDDAFYASRSDFVLENNGSMEDLRIQIVELIDFLESDGAGAGQ